MKTKMMKFADGEKPVFVGQKVIVTNGQSGKYHYHSHEDTIDKIGNKYVTVGRRQFDFDGYENTTAGTKGQIYSSQKEYERIKVENKIINTVRSVMLDWRHKINYEQALKIAEILNIKLD